MGSSLSQSVALLVSIFLLSLWPARTSSASDDSIRRVISSPMGQLGSQGGPRRPDQTWEPHGGLLPAVDRGRFGYIDRTGAWAIAPQFDVERNFVEGLAFVERGGKWGCIDATGRLVIPLQFDWAYDFSGGLARVGIGTQWGYINTKGQFVFIPRTLTSSSVPSDLPTLVRCSMNGFSDKMCGTRVEEPSGTLDVSAMAASAGAGRFDDTPVAEASSLWPPMATEVTVVTFMIWILLQLPRWRNTLWKRAVRHATDGFGKHAFDEVRAEQTASTAEAAQRESLRSDAALEPYRLAIQRRARSLCWDHPFGQVTPDQESGTCRISRFLPDLVSLAKAVGPDDVSGFEWNVERAICAGRCGNIDGTGCCPLRAKAGCCLYRNLPLVYDALEHALGGQS